MDETKDTKKTGEGTSRRRWMLVALMASGALAALLAARPIAAAIQSGGEALHRRMASHWGGLHGFSPEAAREHLQVATKWALRDIDASEEQQERVSGIVAGAADDLFRLRDRHLQNRQALHAQLSAATVDRAALEEIRKSEMALADEASKRIVQALADAADVLTPEQRQALAERIHRHQMH